MAVTEVTEQSAAAPAKKAPRSQFAKQQERLAFYLLAPTLILILVVAAWPLYQAVRLSFTNERLGRPGQGEYVGLENYQALLGEFVERPDGSTRFKYDKDFYEAVINTVILTVVAVTLELIVGLGIALVINSKFKAITFKFIEKDPTSVKKKKKRKKK